MVGHTNHPNNDSDRVYRRLLEQYTPLIKKVVKSLGFYQNRHDHEGLEADDAFQAGSLGLWFASMGHDETKATFISHAYNCIRWEILDEMRRTGWSRGRVSIPVNYEDFRDYQAHADVEAEAIAGDLLDKIDDVVIRMDLGRRTVFQGLMRHQGRLDGKRNHDKTPDGSKGVPYQHISDALGVSKSRVYQLRSDIRSKLRTIH